MQRVYRATRVSKRFTAAIFPKTFKHPGPSWSLTHDVKGRTATKVIPESFVPQAREQIAEYRRLRELTHDLVGVNEKICEARIEGGTRKESIPSRIVSSRPYRLIRLPALSEGFFEEATPDSSSPTVWFPLAVGAYLV